MQLRVDLLLPRVCITMPGFYIVFCASHVAFSIQHAVGEGSFVGRTKREAYLESKRRQEADGTKGTK